MNRRKSWVPCIALVLGWLALALEPYADDRPPSGALHVRVVCDRWPDPSNLHRFSLDAIRLMEARTNEEKALAVWRFIRMFSARTDGRNPREPALRNNYIDDPVKVLTVYGAHWCDGLARVMEAAWRALGFRAEKLYRSGHTQANVHWEDEDGISRWHLMDVSEGWYVYDRTGRHIASPDEIATDYSLIFRPSNGPVPGAAHYWGIHNWVHAPHIAWPKHSGELNLRPGEKSTRLWGNLGLPYQDNFAAKGKKDFEHGPYPVTYGNGMLQYAPDLASAACKNGLPIPPENVRVREEDGLSPNIHPAVAASTSSVIFPIESPFIISDAWVSGRFRRRNDSDRLTLSISTDTGKSWKEVWRADQTGDLVLDRLPIAEKFNIYKAVPARLVSPFGRYGYLLKAEFFASGDVTAVGLHEIEITTVTQHNIFALPQLWPGNNQITVHGEIGADTSLRITYAWKDRAGDHQKVAIAETTPFTYRIHADGTKWEDVITTSLTLEAIPRIGKGSHVIAKRGDAGTAPRLAAGAAFDTRKIVGSRVPAPLKTAAQYIADLGVPAEQNRALNGLILLKDPSSLDSVKRLAFESTSFPTKELAIQALYRIGGERSIPFLMEILQKSPAVRWKTDAGNKFVELEHWYTVASLIGQIMAEADIPAAAPHLCAVLDNILANNNQSWEPHAGIIRALGRLKDETSAAAIRPFLNRNADVSATAIWALGELRDHASAAAIKDIYARSDYAVQRMRAIEALAKLGRQDIFPELCTLLEHPDENMRAAAVEAMGKLENRAAIPYLEKLVVTETFPWIKAMAVDSLSTLAEPGMDER